MLRRGEGGGAARGGPLWSPVVLVPLHHHVINKTGYTGDHKGPPNPSQPPSPLREIPAVLRLMRIEPIDQEARDVPSVGATAAGRLMRSPMISTSRAAAAST